MKVLLMTLLGIMATLGTLIGKWGTLISLIGWILSFFFTLPMFTFATVLGFIGIFIIGLLSAVGLAYNLES